YRRLVEAEPGAGKFGCLLDTFESLLYFLTVVVISQYWREGASDIEHTKRLLEKFYKGKWSVGDLMELLRETTRLYRQRPNDLPYPQLVGYLFTRDGRPTPSLQVLESFVALRNEAWGHGAGRTDSFYRSIFEPNYRLLQEELNRCEWLTTRQLWLPKFIDEQARVVKTADGLMGERRLRDRELNLQLRPEDLDLNGGDVLPEQTLLLVNPDTGEYLPLFPLSLFLFLQQGQAAFFLNTLEWAQQRRLQKAHYIAYDPWLQAHEARAQQPPVLSLEAKIQLLEGVLRAQGVQLERLTQLVQPARSDYNLPEVWVEQAYHLKGFVGREGWLQRLRTWLQQSVEGGYFLLLGPQGQGKSALLAQFAYEQGAT
ncbi:MAG: hypothetical protein NZL85_04040, partial [Fimbriimonadales bacterium]|nr:hypothetical protein [Fimbriimonadales bacterium]